MPWKKTPRRSPQWLFVSAVLKGTDCFSEVCRAHGISRVTGYKWWDRFEQHGRSGLEEKSRRPRCFGNAWPALLRGAVRTLSRRYPTWGAQKLHWALKKQRPVQAMPGVRTLQRWLPERIKPVRRRRGTKLAVRKLTEAFGPNEVWTIDFKGWFRTQDGDCICPLTVRDLYSGYLLLVRHVAVPSERNVRRILRELFSRFGLPRIMRSDNGAPFAGCGALGLSRLSVWLLRLGVQVEFGRPGRPGDNAKHEQMHRILKADTACPPALTRTAQIRRLRRWRTFYNERRPYQPWNAPPIEHYHRSRRVLPSALPPCRYPRQLQIRTVSSGGLLRWKGGRYFLGRAFAAQLVGLRKHRTGLSIWLGPKRLGLLNLDQGRFDPIRPHHRA